MSSLELKNLTVHLKQVLGASSLWLTGWAGGRQGWWDRRTRGEVKESGRLDQLCVILPNTLEGEDLLAQSTGQDAEGQRCDVQ